MAFPGFSFFSIVGIPTWEAEVGKNIFPQGWSEKRVEKLISHYENQTEEEAVAEDETPFEKRLAGLTGKNEKSVVRRGKNPATKLLSKAFSVASLLPPQEQNTFAAWILAEI